MEITYTNTIDDYVEGHMFVSAKDDNVKRVTRLWKICLAVIVIVLSFLFFHYWGIEAVVILLISFFGVTFLPSKNSSRDLIRKSLMKNPVTLKQLLLERTLSCEEEKLIAVQGGNRTEWSWGSFDGVYNDASYIYLVSFTLGSYYIPKIAFSDECSMKLFYDFVVGKCGKSSSEFVTEESQSTEPRSHSTSEDRSTLAVISLVLSAVALVSFDFTISIPGIICGHIALSDIKRKENIGGRKIALTGVCIGYISVIVGILFVLSAFWRSDFTFEEIMSISNESSTKTVESNNDVPTENISEATTNNNDE